VSPEGAGYRAIRVELMFSGMTCVLLLPWIGFPFATQYLPGHYWYWTFPGYIQEARGRLHQPAPIRVPIHWLQSSFQGRRLQLRIVSSWIVKSASDLPAVLDLRDLLCFDSLSFLAIVSSIYYVRGYNGCYLWCRTQWIVDG
jgi:hypothetical protein